MRIAQIAPLAESVPPKLYGGTERVISWLTEELVQVGHEVTLFASGDSETSGELVPVIPRALRLGRPHRDPAAASAILLEAMAEAADEFDLIHCHLDWIALPLLRRLGVPYLTTLHGRLDLPGLKELVSHFAEAPFVSISNNQRKPLADANWLGTVYHGLPANLHRPSFEPGSYLAFLGRLTPEKGPETAIRLAEAVGQPLHISAKLPSRQNRYFNDRLRPLIDEKQIHFTGELDEAGKTEFLRNASALLFPIHWPEPFGLVMIEAIACGTPVIAYRCGSVPEVIENGATGFIVETDDEAVEAIARIKELDRRFVRKRFEARFTARQMAEAYLALYRGLIEKGRHNPKRSMEHVYGGSP
jgi:glycosyltransferase involved in cell wall biosynthesis